MSDVTPPQARGRMGLAQWVRRNKVLAAVIALGGVLLYSSHRGAAMGGGASDSAGSGDLATPTAGYASSLNSDGSGAWFDPGATGTGGGGTSLDPAIAGDGTVTDPVQQPSPVTIQINPTDTSGQQLEDAAPVAGGGVSRATSKAKTKRVPGKGRRKGSVKHGTHRTSAGHAHTEARRQHHTNAVNHHNSAARHHARALARLPKRGSTGGAHAPAAKVHKPAAPKPAPRPAPRPAPKPAPKKKHHK